MLSTARAGASASSGEWRVAACGSHEELCVARAWRGISPRAGRPHSGLRVAHTNITIRMNLRDRSGCASACGSMWRCFRSPQTVLGGAGPGGGAGARTEVEANYRLARQGAN
eukprot:2897809-Prymnesium_polylepis.1